MGSVILTMSMSLDGYINAANETVDVPMGEGGLVLHDWAMDTTDERNRAVLSEGIGSIGAVIAGRTTYDMSIRWWGADGPTGPARVPLIVVSHDTPEDIPDDSVYTFVDGIEAAHARAKAVAGDRDISLMGGANISQQFLNAGLVDSIQIHLVPVIFGSGTRLFDHLDGEHIHLETTDVLHTAQAIHMHFRVK